MNVRFQDVRSERFMVKLKQGNGENNSLNFLSPKTVFHVEIPGTGVLLLDTKDGLGKAKCMKERNTQEEE